MKYYGKISETKKKTEKTTETIDKRISMLYNGNCNETKNNNTNKNFLKEKRTMVSEYEIKKQICDIGKRIYDRNMVAANDGNISVKISENEFLCTPTGVSKGFMTPEYICKIDRQGNIIQANPGF